MKETFWNLLTIRMKHKRRRDLLYEEPEFCLQERAINDVSEAMKELQCSKASWEDNVSADLILSGGLQLWRLKKALVGLTCVREIMLRKCHNAEMCPVNEE
jgi:hypothetical protein